MEIRLTNHAEDKLLDESFAPGVAITKETINAAVLHPDSEQILEGGKIRAVAAISNRHSLVVIYKDLGEYLLIITFWPARKGRYES